MPKRAQIDELKILSIKYGTNMSKEDTEMDQTEWPRPAKKNKLARSTINCFSREGGDDRRETSHFLAQGELFVLQSFSIDDGR